MHQKKRKVSRHKEKMIKSNDGFWANWQAFFLLAIFLRLFLTALPSYAIDMGGYLAWSRYLADFGPQHFYSTFHVVYAPFYQYLLWFTGEIAKILTVDNAMHIWFIKLWAVLADIIACYLLIQIGKNSQTPQFSYPLAMFYLLNPAIIFNASVWGQFDGIPALFLTFSLYLFTQKQPIFGAYFFLLAVLTKPQSALLLPLILLIFIVSLQGQRFLFQMRQWAFTLIGGLGLYLVLVLPFYERTPLADKIPKALDPIWWIFHLYLSSVQDYPYASANAFNIWFLLGKQIVPDTQPFLGIPMNLAGLILFSLSTGFALTYFFRHKNDPFAPYIASWISLLSAFLFMTKMHERYLVPALLLGTVALFAMKKWLWPFVAASVLSGVNQAVLYALSQKDEYWLPASYFFGKVCSFLLLFIFVYTIYVLIIDEIGRNNEKDFALRNGSTMNKLSK